MFSDNLRDVNHIDHQFVDWDAGITPDGKYLYIKQGTNAETGNTWGLDMSIARGIEIVKSGLASHIWMETPDADLAVAKIYMDSVNKELEKYGLKARGLYNHSPSFDWDVKFYAEAKKLIDELIRNIPTNIKTQEIASVISHWLESNGNTIIGDNLFTNDSIYKLAQNAHDYLLTSNMRKSQLETLTNMLENEEGIISQDMKEVLYLYSNDQEKPYRNMCDEVVRHRLTTFEPLLANYGFDLHLITLPEFHVIAHNMHELARDFNKEGINAFVRHAQRPERIKYEQDYSFTYYKHQTATGTGLEAQFNKLVGSSDVNTLSESTEADDLAKRT